jgi:hypothetical protein
MGSRAICVSRDAEVRRVVGDALVAAGVLVAHRETLDGGTDGVALVVVDRATRQAEGEALRALDVPVVVVGDDLEDDGLITLMLEAPVSHLVRDPADRQLGITSQKLTSGDLFGLEKYVTADGRIGERVVTTVTEKRAAMAEICSWAEAIGARRPVLHRIANVVDELLMNALIDAPREADASGPLAARAIVRWASDERAIAISVGDAHGALRQRDVIGHVRRARDERGRPELDQPGAGLGLYLVLANVVSLIVNVDPGHCTEVVCLFDLARGGRAAVSRGMRSLHVFSSP